MRTEALARILERDILREREAHPTQHVVMDCHTCGRSFLYKGPDGDNPGRFCSARCREAYDSGAPRFESKNNPLYCDRADNSMRIGRHGFLIECKGCGKEFDSKGLKCCSTQCDRTYRQRQEAEAVMAEVNMDRPDKRKCQHCGGDIPNWRNGRRVSKAVRFCTPKCQRQSAQNSGSGPV
jgi:hypothetical protein